MELLFYDVHLLLKDIYKYIILINNKNLYFSFTIHVDDSIQ